MATLPAIAITGDSIPKLPPRLNSLIDSTGSWNDSAGSLVGWKKPERLPVGMAAMLKLWIPKMEAALAPMARVEPVKMALVRLHALLPGRQSDAVQAGVWYEAMLQHLRPYPERSVLEALAEIERKSKWRPAPAEILAIIERDFAGPRDELRRMRDLALVGEQPAIAAPKLRPFEEWTPEERARHDKLMAGYRASLPEVAAPSAPKGARRYTLIERGWPRHLSDAWLAGYEARHDGKLLADCRIADRSAREFWIEGHLAAGGVLIGDLVLTEQQAAIIDELTQALASMRADPSDYEHQPGA